MRYDAFVSYSHAADHAVAPALQSALHAFARPWNRLRALTVFRDQTSLAASPELWPAIEAALAESRWLLLMASPPAAASRWVAREIDWWLANRSAQTLLIVVTGGELQWDEAARDFDWARTDCLPRAPLAGRLRGEPLWVDLRWAHDGELLTLRQARFRQAVLDIAAPLHGRPKDELDGEDVRRFARVQRLRNAVIVALSGLTLLAGGAAWVAWRQRDEALRQATIAQAGRIATQADLLRERGGPVDSAVMLAAEALQRLDGIGARSADADLSLRRALAQLPLQRGTLQVSADTMRLTPDGTLLLTSHTADQQGAVALPGGAGRGCPFEALKAARSAGPDERLWLVDGLSDNAAWCVVHVFLGGRSEHRLELWSAAPLRHVATVALPSQAGHVRPLVAPDGRWLAASDLPQSGALAGTTLRLWRIGEDGSVAPLPPLVDTAAVRFAPDGRHLATSGGLWALPVQGEAAQRLRWTAPPWKLAFAADGTHVAAQAGPDSEIVVWDIARADDRWRAHPPPGELLALGPGGTRLVVAGAHDSTLWDVELDLARAVLPQRADAAALPGGGEALFVVPVDTRTGLPRQLLLALPDAPAALAAGRFPGAADAVVQMALGGDGALRLLEHDRAAGAVRVHRWQTAPPGWSLPVALDGVRAFDMAADAGRYAAATAQAVLVGPVDGSAPPTALAPPLAADRLVLGRDGRQLLAHGEGRVHAWDLVAGTHWSVALDVMPEQLALTRDGRQLLAVVSAGAATRGGTPLRLLRWRLGDAAAPDRADLGRPARPSDTLCELLGADGRLGLTRADLPACDAPAAAAPGWRIDVQGRLATVSAPDGTELARLDHAVPVRLAAVAADGRFAATLDEGGLVQRFALAPAELIAQACTRQPAPLGPAERAALPPQRRDACGRAIAD